MNMNSQKTRFSLGWQPDLPDHRDKMFSGAKGKLADWVEKNEAPDGGNPIQPTRRGAAKSAPRMAEEGGNPWQARIKAGNTFSGWAQSALAAQKLAGETPESIGTIRFNKALTCAFKDKDRQRKYLLAHAPETSHSAVDLRSFMSPVEDQGNIGSCTAHAVMGLIEYLQIATRAQYVDGSRLFLYKTTRDLLHWSGDTGAYIRETIKAIRLFGVCPESYWTYDTARCEEEPSAFCYAYGSNYKAMRYYRLADLEDIKQSISQGYPVAFGFTCFESTLSNGTARTGRIPMPLPTEKREGGHAVLAIGYNDGPSDPNNPNACPQNHFIIRNSWGTGWGRAGYGFLPYEYFTGNGSNKIPLADDFWTMTQMEIPELEQTSAAPYTLGDDGGNDVQGGGGGSQPQ